MTKITAEVGKDFELCPSGNHAGSCYAIIVIGTVMESFEGRAPEPKSKIILGFEITGKTYVAKEGEAAKPHVLWKEHLLSYNKKSNLRKDIHSWAGKAFSDAEMKDFDMADLLTAEALVNVVADKNKDGKDRVKVGTISPIPEGMTVMPMINEKLLFNYTNPFDQASFDRIPEWIQKKMKESTEYKQALGAGLTNTVIASTSEAPAEKKGGFPFKKKL